MELLSKDAPRVHLTLTPSLRSLITPRVWKGWDPGRFQLEEYVEGPTSS